MVDVFSRKKRSQVMAAVKGANNRSTELFVAALLRKNKVHGWRRGLPIFGKPDFVFRGARVAVFVDGCFWHACPLHGSLPKTNREFWRKKLTRNRERDREVDKRLKLTGWHVVRVWHHELNEPRRVLTRIARSLGD